MLQIITPEICNKLGEIGFEQDEINTIQIIHELKTRTYPIDIKKLINQIAFKKLSEGIAETFEMNRWNEEDFFEVVEKHRDEKKNK
ncbi:hypothetical protein TI05_05870 [Achromatium sp. WMS3]|nr:hypothetical protein TI05_05870 [Achromatium sp. WMS3]